MKETFSVMTPEQKKTAVIRAKSLRAFCDAILEVAEKE
jgi:hypothetical protein